MRKTVKKPTCIGTGLVALDVIINSIENSKTDFLVGGSCGNVLTILSYFNWSTFPMARLSNNTATELLLEDLKNWNVNEKFLEISESGSTPVIIHRILKDSQGAPKHRFEFRNPEDGKYLPSFKPVLSKSVPQLLLESETPNLFYFDRISRSAIELAKKYKENGAVIFFEPSSIKDIKAFHECMKVVDVIKFANDRIKNYEELFNHGKVGLEIQTLGSDGLKFRKKGQKQWEYLASYKIENVVDTAGAGDWCTCGIILNLFSKNKKNDSIKDDEIIHSLKYGQALSALNCTYQGARGLMYNVTSYELEKLVNKILIDEKILNKISLSSSKKVPSNHEIKISSLFIRSTGT